MVNTTRSTLLNTTAKSQEEKNKNPISNAWVLLWVSLGVHFLALCMSAVAFFAPFWRIELNTWYRTGLWGRCDGFDWVCVWFMERNYAWERSLTGWHVAAQVLYAIGIGVLFIAFCLGVGQIIFRCCKTTLGLPSIIGLMTLGAMLFELVSVMCFGIGAYRDFEVSINSWVGHFDWAFYVAIAALFVDTIAGLLFLAAGSKFLEEMKGYGDIPYGVK